MDGRLFWAHLDNLPINTILPFFYLSVLHFLSSASTKVLKYHTKRHLIVQSIEGMHDQHQRRCDTHSVCLNSMYTEPVKHKQIIE